MSTFGFHHLIQGLGKAARMPFPLHPHMLRHACGYKLAKDGHDTRALQRCLGYNRAIHRAFARQVPRFLARLDWRSARSTAGRNWRGPAHLKRAWMCVRQMTPGWGGALDSENCSCPL